MAVCLAAFPVEACQEASPAADSQEAPTPCSAVQPLFNHNKRSVAHL